MNEAEKPDPTQELERLRERVAMPSNNLMLIFDRQGAAA